MVNTEIKVKILSILKAIFNSGILKGSLLSDLFLYKPSNQLNVASCFCCSCEDFGALCL